MLERCQVRSPDGRPIDNGTRTDQFGRPDEQRRVRSLDGGPIDNGTRTYDNFGRPGHDADDGDADCRRPGREPL